MLGAYSLPCYNERPDPLTCDSRLSALVRITASQYITGQLGLYRQHIPSVIYTCVEISGSSRNRVGRFQ